MLSVYPPRDYVSKDGRKILVRPAAFEDFDETITTFGEVAAEKVYLNTETLSPDIRQVWEERWQTNAVDTLFCIAVVDGRITGGLVLNKFSRSPKTDHVRELGMWIIKPYRSIGVGNAMMSYSLDWARSSGAVRKITLGVWNTNINAQMLYSKFGFHIDGCRVGIARIGDRYVDEILMSLDL